MSETLKAVADLVRPFHSPEAGQLKLFGGLLD